MEELNSFVCKTCGARLNVLSAIDGVLECEYCGNVWTVPKPETNKEAIGFLQIGEHDLDTCKFSDAFMAYKRAAELDSGEPEAYFGMALSEFKVQYVKDEVNKRIQPICHINSDKAIAAKKFSDNKYYKKALELATSAQHSEYRKIAEEIDRIREEFLKLKNKGIDYDCFICVKVSDGQNGRTNDYIIADEIYTDLKRQGYKPFFSERELEAQTGSDYEAYILYALYSSECMLVVCSDEEYLNTPWVKNEYTRFLSMIADERKESDSITIVFKGSPIEYLPGKKGKIQGINRSSLDAVNRIREYVEAHSPEGKKRREQEAAKKEEAERRLREEQQAMQRRLEEQIKDLRNQNVSSASGITAGSLVTRAFMFIEDGDFENANSYAEKALDMDPKLAEAYLVKFMVGLRVTRRTMLGQRSSLSDFSGNNYDKMMRFADSALKAEIEGYRASVTDRINRLKEEQRAKEAERQRKAIENKYNEACRNLFTCKLVSQVEKVRDLFVSLGDYKDSKAKIEECNERIKEIQYNEADGVLYKSILLADIESVKKDFIKLGNYKDSKQKVEECDKKIEQLKAEAERKAAEARKRQKRKKRNTFIVVTAIILVIAIAAGVVAKFFIDKSARGGLELTLSDDGTYYIVTGIEGKSYERTKDFVIPVSYKGLPVREIGDNAFISYLSLKSVTIPDSITKIGKRAFYQCPEITSITIPDSVTEIGEEAFGQCKIQEATIPANAATYIKNSYLKTVTITSGEIEDGAFAYSNIVSVTIEDKVTGIGIGAFSGCRIQNATIPAFAIKYMPKAKLTTVIITSGDNIEGLSMCESLTSVTLPDGITSIPNYAFNGCSSLTSVNIPAGVTEIGYKAFCDCSSLTSITIPANVEEIPGYAFANCSSLKSITIPANVTRIESYAFNGCSKLSSVNFEMVGIWIVHISNDYNGNLTILPDDLTKPSVAAQYLVSTYSEYGWWRRNWS